MLHGLYNVLGLYIYIEHYDIKYIYNPYLKQIILQNKTLTASLLLKQNVDPAAGDVSSSIGFTTPATNLYQPPRDYYVRAWCGPGCI